MNKKILIVSECFYPEEFKINDVALRWKEEGYDVDVLTMVPSYPESEIYEGFKNRLFQKDEYKGINIYRVKTVRGYKNSLLKKLFKYLTFMLLGSIVSLKIGKKYDYVFGYDVGPLTGMIPAVLLNKFYKKSVTLWVQDIWPDSVYAYGFKKSRALDVFLNTLVRFVYRHTDGFAVSCRGFEQKIVPFLDKNKSIVYAPNWADEMDRNLEDFNFGDSKKVHFTFAGNIGKVQNLDNVIKAFAALKEEHMQKAQLNIIGDGSYLHELKQMVSDNSFKNIVFWGRKPRNEMFKYFNASDFLIVSLTDKPIFALTVPAKTQTYISAGKPIIGVVKGEAADIIINNTLGYIADPGSVDEITNAFEKAISTDENVLGEFSKNSEVLTKTVFNKTIIIDTLLDLLIGKERQ